MCVCVCVCVLFRGPDPACGETAKRSLVKHTAPESDNVECLCGVFQRDG